MALKANAAAAAEFVPGIVSLSVLGSSQSIPEFVPGHERIDDFSSNLQDQSTSAGNTSFLERSNDSALKTSIKFMPSHVDAPEFVPGSVPKPGFDGLVDRAGEFRPSFQFGGASLGDPSNIDSGSAAAARIPEFIPNAHPPYVQSDEFIGIAESSPLSPSAQGLEFGFEGTYESDPNLTGEVKKDLEFGENYGAVHEKEGWAEIASVQFGHNSIDQDNSIVYATFDPVEELVWAGTASGRLCSHLVQYASQDCR
jgi:hypothetical protein